MSIKTNRAMKIATTGRYPRSFAAMLDAIPESVVEALNARLIAELIDANWRLAGCSKRIAEHEAVANGFVWDHRRGRAMNLTASADEKR